ncbi:MAG: TolC family protein [Cyclobacteriaceae bacterium]
MKGRILMLMLLTTGSFAWAQEPSSSAFTVYECVDYAIENAAQMKNARLNEQSAEAKVKETIGIGLPQITGSVGLQHSPTLQRFFAQYNSAGGGFGLTTDQAAQLGVQDGDVYSAENFFQLQSAGDAKLSISQLIFNGSYIVGLQASQAYKDLSIKQKEDTEGRLAVAVGKAFFSVLINEDRLELYDANIARLDTLYRNTREMYKNGLTEQLEVDRLKVSLNNLKTERATFEDISELSRQLLKFQMGYPLNEPIELSGSILDMLKEEVGPIDGEVTYEDRPDYRVLMANKKLQELNIKNKYAESLPSIGAFANLGMSTQSPNFGGLFSTESGFEEQQGVGPDSWYNYSNVGLSLQWNLFSGLQRNFQIQQEKIALKQIENNVAMAQDQINLEVLDAGNVLSNAMERLEVQRENIELAERVYKNSKIKYEEGVGSSLELVDADRSLKEAQTNYYNTIFEAILAKIDLDAAKGLTRKQ